MTTVAKKTTVQKKKVVPEPEMPVETAPVPETPEVPAPEAEEQDVEKQLEHLREIVNSTIKDLNEKLKTFKTIESVIKKLGTSIKKELKSSKKKKTRKNSNISSEHGFNAPVKISDELADFLQVDRGTKLRRPEVTSLISKYANENNLKDEKNRGIFKPDAKLKKLLGPAVHPLKKKSEVKGYGIFNLQIYLKRHFVKEQPVEA